MPYTFSYAVALPYQVLPGFSYFSPALSVTLRKADRAIQAVGILDTASTYTIFQQEFAEGLGITDLTEGIRDEVLTGGGRFYVYLFDAELEIAVSDTTLRFAGQVGFPEHHIHRNILGLNLVFQHLNIAFRDHKQLIYLLPEEFDL
jgi:hypothetical protein